MIPVFQPRTAHELFDHYRQVRARIWRGPTPPDVTPPPETVEAFVAPVSDIKIAYIVIPADIYYATQLTSRTSAYEILHAVCRRWGTNVELIRSAVRFADVTLARRAFCAVAYHLSSLSTVQLGRIINRDHSTVLHAVRAADDMMAAITAHHPTTTEEWVDHAYRYFYEAEK